ncbi:LOW QUALITY PROTEIN: uncharacterized protein [Panulirus ornatus]|uniref:LOW QUALITY PROTEIN: uncharacterized protein n=1 Tax=Panulirus ornatus TaxID=150431 RepID=UPI003A843B75
MKRTERNMPSLRTCAFNALLWTFLLDLSAAPANGEATPLGLSVVSIVETMIEKTVALPCKATLHPHGDTPNLLLFYRHSSNIPFFSYDARTGDFWRVGNSKTRDARYEGRVSLNLTQPHTVHLNLQRVTLQDQGDFTCRVDFLSSPSLTSIVKLKVYANPSVGPTVRVGLGLRGSPIRPHSDVGPFHEGEMLNLSCAVTGGFPSPVVTWWRGLQLLDNSSHVVNGNGAPREVNELQLGPLTRALIETPFTCRSENNPLSTPLERSLHVKIHMAPQSVELASPAAVQAGLEERLECRAKGAYPEANITWTLNGTRLNFTAKETRQVGSDTISWIRFKASPKENGARLTCTASSATLPDPPVSTNATLNVTHSPLARLQLGSSLRPEHIRQGDDVYFDCLVVANPPVLRIAWYKEVNGPMCTHGRMTVTTVEGEVVTLECTVDAYPANVTFHWLFNNTVDSTRFRPNEYTAEGSVSRLRYAAYSARDYGTVFCWASNVVGRQQDPCAFILQPAGAPDSVHGCVLTNQSAGSLHITCKPGADGGLTQTFRAEVYTGGLAKAVRVLEGMAPVFTLEGLAPGGDYVVRVTAMNRKGASPPVSLEAFTLKVAENRMISSSPPVAVSGVSSSQPLPAEGAGGAVSPLLGVFLGIVGAFLLLAAAAVFITRRHCSRGAGRTPDLVAGQELEVKGEVCEAAGGGKTDPREDTDLTEADPFLATSHCGTTVASGGVASGGVASVVFTIPAHIPPPPQYCTQHAPAPAAPRAPRPRQAPLPQVGQHSLQRASPLPHCLQRASSLEGVGLAASGAPQLCLARGSPPTRGHHHAPAHHPQAAAHHHPQAVYTTGTDAALLHPPATGLPQAAPHPAAVHYVQPHPGLGAEPPLGAQHVGLAHLGAGGMSPQRTIVPQGAPGGHPSPKTRAKHVTWLGGSCGQGEESAV